MRRWTLAVGHAPVSLAFATPPSRDQPSTTPRARLRIDDPVFPSADRRRRG